MSGGKKKKPALQYQALPGEHAVTGKKQQTIRYKASTHSNLLCEARTYKHTAPLRTRKMRMLDYYNRRSRNHFMFLTNSLQVKTRIFKGYKKKSPPVGQTLGSVCLVQTDTSLINFLPPTYPQKITFGLQKKKILGGYCFCLLPKTKKINLDCLGHETTSRSLKHFV